MDSQAQHQSPLYLITACTIPILLVACNRSLWGDLNTGKNEGSGPGTIYSALPDQVNPNESYLFYIHGKIIETDGIDAVSPEFGVYEFKAILEYYAEAGFNVIGEVRDSPPDPDQYTAHVGEGIEYLINQGVGSDQITVVGFSKGGGLTILVSDLMKDPELKYVLIGICGDWIDRNLELTGNVLSLYEESDYYGSSCQGLADRSPDLTSFDEIQFKTGKGHGAFYQADPLWLDPVIEWLKREEK